MWKFPYVFTMFESILEKKIYANLPRKQSNIFGIMETYWAPKLLSFQNRYTSLTVDLKYPWRKSDNRGYYEIQKKCRMDNW